MKRNVNFKKGSIKTVLMLAVVLAGGFSAKAQNLAGGTPGTPNPGATAIAKQAAAKDGQVGNGLTDGGSVRVVDNKGTIKYLQVQNGITQVTNIDPTNGGIVTTWQLGGSLTDNTYIDATGKSFALDGLKMVTTAPSLNTAAQLDGTKHSATPATNGYTFLVRDEATGETMKLSPADLVKTGAINQKLTAAGPFSYTDPAFMPSDVSKVSVYRNGIKLLAGIDYTLTVVAGGASTVAIAATGGADPEDFALMINDRIEVQWIN